MGRGAQSSRRPQTGPRSVSPSQIGANPGAGGTAGANTGVDSAGGPTEAPRMLSPRHDGTSSGPDDRRRPSGRPDHTRRPRPPERGCSPQRGLAGSSHSVGGGRGSGGSGASSVPPWRSSGALSDPVRGGSAYKRVRVANLLNAEAPAEMRPGPAHQQQVFASQPQQLPPPPHLLHAPYQQPFQRDQEANQLKAQYHSYPHPGGHQPDQVLPRSTSSTLSRLPPPASFAIPLSPPRGHVMQPSMQPPPHLSAPQNSGHQQYQGSGQDLSLDSGSSGASGVRRAGFGDSGGSGLAPGAPSGLSLDSGCVCVECKASFQTREALSAHRRKEHPRFDLVCPHCHSSFFDRGNLNKHVRSVHENQRPFKCDRCSSAFSFSDGLRRHVQMVHLGERPHVCPYCGTGFKQRAHLTKHQSALHPEKRGGGDGSRGGRGGGRSAGT